MAGRGSGAVVEGRDVADGRLVFGALAGSRLDAVSCYGRLPGGCGHRGRGSPVFRYAEGGLHRGPRGGPGVLFLSARGLSLDRCGCTGRASRLD